MQAYAISCLNCLPVNDIIHIIKLIYIWSVKFMKQIERHEMVEFLRSLDSRRYIDFIALSGQQHITADFYIDYNNNNDFIGHLKHGNTFHEYYFTLSKEENIKFLCELIKMREKVFRDVAMLYSYDKSFYTNTAFIESFEIIEQHVERKYGFFGKIEPQIVLPKNDKIRELTADDIDITENFYKENEQYFPYYELLNYNDSLKNGSKTHKIYGYFRNNKLTAFVTIHAVNVNYWDIGYIFTSPQYRQNGMGVNLAKYFINEFIYKDVFISYGSAQNENSQKTALAAGCELFSEMYYYCVK